jgi:hypothetical protein
MLFFDRIDYFYEIYLPINKEFMCNSINFLDLETNNNNTGVIHLTDHHRTDKLNSIEKPIIKYFQSRDEDYVKKSNKSFI